MNDAAGAEPYIVISADAHAGASVTDYRPYLASKWHDEFDLWAVGARSRWEVANAGREEQRNWDSAMRDQANDAAGIAAELIFPNTMPPFYPRGDLTSSLPTSRDDYERRLAGLQAHNRWTIDFCAQSPGRRRGLVQILLNDIDDALAEIRWGKEAGLAGILIPGVRPNHPTVEGLWSRRYDPIWALADELEMVVNQHTGAGLPEVGNDSAELASWTAEGSFYARRTLWNLMFAGVFDRFPHLRFIMTEEGLDWIGPTMTTLEYKVNRLSDDRMFFHRVFGPAAKALKLRPTEYLQRNCFITASGEVRREELSARTLIGVDHVLWGADYPHEEGTHPYTREALRALFADVPDNECRRMLAFNAADLYGFDLEGLLPVAQRIGPSPEELHTPLDHYPEGSTLEVFLGKLPVPRATEHLLGLANPRG
jgi:predicted TIM-barrel fold metal-dependent hydrolase